MSFGRLFFVSAVIFLLVGNNLFAQPMGEPKLLAPDVMKVIPVSLGANEAFSTHDIVELTTGNTSPSERYDLNYSYWAENIRFDRRVLPSESTTKKAVSCLEFQFKPLRMIEVELPNAQGKLEKKLVWYMIYAVVNKKWTPENTEIAKKLRDPVKRDDLPQLDLAMFLGSSLSSEAVADGMFQLKPEDAPINFVPQFILATTQPSADQVAKNGYTDQQIPLALGPIIRREDPNRNFETTISMADKVIQPGETVWGVVLWTDIDPKLNYFSVFVSGLSTAYQWTNPEGAYKKDDPPGTGREMLRKTLKLNFWRPGDVANLSEKDIRYGVPIPNSVQISQESQKDGQAPVDYEWVYR